ncbi:amino acid adenylation domain-containing protein [Nostoc sp. HK-01]|nr:amino acid adenylation domain-containing protein [Nostoc sp. HK-01]
MNNKVNTLSNTETFTSLQECYTTEVINTSSMCIHELFEQQVESSPDEIAVVFLDVHSEGTQVGAFSDLSGLVLASHSRSISDKRKVNQQLTYRELNQQANQLAHYLRYLGVGPEVLVGICLERSLQMAIAILAVLKAGGAYVPLDPSYPLERLAFILEDTQAPILLTQEKFLPSLPNLSGKVICLDSDWQVIAQNSQENPINKTSPDNLIYVIYTSGSTGQPKGVMIPHKGIYNQLYWRQTSFKLTAADKVLQTISFSFDPSVWQIFWPLCFGAQLVMAHPEGHRDSAYLVKVICEQQITVMALVPSMLQVLLEEKGIENCRCLRHITCGGEALPVELIERFFERLCLDNVLFNCYGPTEASIDASFWKCQRGTNYLVAPIGCPITNTEIYILNEDLQPVAIGEPGELYIGGVGLARGYLNRPQLTAEKFIPHLFSQEPGARLYKTGDLVSYLPDSNIEFLGRIDQQLKIRGFRIELGEIEATLNQHPALKQTLVMAREDVPGNKRLVAYVVAHPEQIPSQSQLHRFLQDKLPEYMIPATFVFLDALPLNPNGKVDRRSLPAPESFIQKLTEFIAPSNSLELQLAQIWQQVLGIQSLGVKDNFFELGGNSLLAMRLLIEINRKLGKSLPLSTFLMAQTIEQLANVLTDQEKSVPFSSLVPIQTAGTKPPLFLVHAMGGNVLFYRDLVKYLEPDQPVYGLQAQGLDGQQTPCTSIVEMASRYLQEIRQIQSHGPYFLAGFSFGGMVAFEMAQQLYAQGEEVAFLALLDTPSSLSGNTPANQLEKSQFFHLFKLLSLKPKDQLAYLWNRINWHFTVGKVSIFYQLYLRYIKRSPLDLQMLAVTWANHQAGTLYLPLIYPGKLTVFRASKSEIGLEIKPDLGWSHLASGGLENYEMPGSHATMIHEPNVKFLAEKLTICLQQARARLLNFF